MKILSLLLTIILCVMLQGCKGQSKKTNQKRHDKIVGGGCDGCELMYIGMPKNIKSIDTSAGWNGQGQKLIVTGTVFKLDGKTAAPNVVIYYWQTDNKGYYSSNKNTDERVKKHGYIRGWVKTNENGKYTIKTIRPAPYPDDVSPAHIHLSIKEPDVVNEYYTDEIHFDDDKLLIPYKNKNKLENRGGSGIVRILLKDSLQIAEHDIVLGFNIPNYPKKINTEKQSGLSIGEDQPSFLPFHAFGPDKGTQTCPVCKYGRYHGLIYFVGNHPNWKEIKHWLSYLEQESVKRQKYLKVYFVYGNNINYNARQREKLLQNLGTELDLKSIALAYVPSFLDEKTEANLNKINPSVGNTLIIYKHRSIIDKYIDLKPTAGNFKIISKILDTQNDYFDLSTPEYH